MLLAIPIYLYLLCYAVQPPFVVRFVEICTEREGGYRAYIFYAYIAYTTIYTGTCMAIEL